MLVPLLTEFVVVASSAVLISGAVSKLLPNAHLVTTLRALGLPDGRPKLSHVVFSLGCVELAAFIGLALYRTWVSGAVVLMLGTSFALAGAYALRRALDLPCSCFGISTNSRLGKTQLAALPVWIVVASLPVTSTTYLSQTLHVRFVTAAFSLATVAALFTWRLLPLWTRATDRRLSVKVAR